MALRTILSDLQKFSIHEYLQQTKTKIKTPPLKSNVKFICWLFVLFSFVNHRSKINRSCEKKSFSFEALRVSVLYVENSLPRECTIK